MRCRREEIFNRNFDLWEDCNETDEKSSMNMRWIEF